MKERIRRFVVGQEIDDVGFAAASDYRSPLSPPWNRSSRGKVDRRARLQGSRQRDSPDLHIAMNGRMDLMEFSRSCNYKAGPPHGEKFRGPRHDRSRLVPHGPERGNQRGGRAGFAPTRSGRRRAGGVRQQQSRGPSPFRMPDRLHGDPHRSRDPLGPSRRRESVHSLRAVRTRLSREKRWTNRAGPT